LKAVELDHVTISLGARVVLSAVDLAIEAGEFVGMLGANGAGKTTLLRTILGLIRPASGEVRVFGTPVSRGNPAVGYMPQNRNIETGMTLRGCDFVASAVSGHRWGLPWLGIEDRRQVGEALALVGATHLADRPLSAMSGGERQRLLLAQSLLGHPKLLLLDEPLISLDPHHQKSIVELARRLQRELKIAVIFSAHELNPLLGAIDRVLYLGRGRAEIGTVDEVITGPVLSRLYGSEIEVIRLNGRIFVMSGEHELEREEHRHDHGHDHAH
jgi:zinc/manganese transport system ATP-binding protein